MRKEIIFAIFAGALFGLVIAFGIWKANLSTKKQEEAVLSENTVEEVEETPSSDTDEYGITISKPTSFQVLTDQTVSISGMTTTKSWIAISGEKEDYVFETGEDGAFEKEVNLVSGVNELVINAYDTNNHTAETKLLLVYSSEFDKSLPEQQ